jgi:multidrug efflux system outer membrane protein
MTPRILIPFAAASMLLSSCAMEPRYDRPASPVPATWTAPAAPPGTPAPAQPTADLGWRDFFRDPALQNLIELSLRQNRDLRVAALNVEAVAAQYRIQRAELFPALNATGSLDKTKSPSSLLYPGEPNPYSIYSVNAGVSSWELDFFGRIRSLKDQALETFLAQKENQRDVQLSVVAQVATEYFTERALAEEVAVARQTLEAQDSSLHLTQRSYEVGSSSELDFRTAQGQVFTARANLASLERMHAETLTQLAVLVGQPPPETAGEPAHLADDGVLADLPAGLPSSLLNRRPDILEAEHMLKAYNANIGAARAAFFPKITLTATGGTESLTLSGLFKGGSSAWTLNPDVVLPIFDAGTNLANLDIAKVEKLKAAAQYEKAVQTAFKEVSDALTARLLYEEQVAAQRSLVEADQIAYTLAEARYRHGVDSYLTALDSQRTLYAAQQGLVQARLERLTNLVSLYEDLGGGWNERTVEKTGPQ